MLVGALVGEFAESILGVGENFAELSEYLLAALGEATVALGDG